MNAPTRLQQNKNTSSVGVPEVPMNQLGNWPITNEDIFMQIEILFVN